MADHQSTNELKIGWCDSSFPSNILANYSNNTAMIQVFGSISRLISYVNIAQT